MTSTNEKYKVTIQQSLTRVPLCCSLSPETQSQHRDSWATELAELDQEILGLEEQIRTKVREAARLKQKLGVTAWREFSQDLREGMRNSTVKNMTTAWSMMLMMSTMRGNSCSSSEVEMMNVSVEITTADNEAKATGILNQAAVKKRPV